MDLDAVRSWVEGYERAWASNDPDDIRSLFTEDARYYTGPSREPWTGWDRIVEGWIGRENEPGTYGFRWEALGASGDLGFVRGWTEYTDEDPPKRYDNLWVIRLTDDGRCSEFIEWWMKAR